MQPRKFNVRPFGLIWITLGLFGWKFQPAIVQSIPSRLFDVINFEWQHDATMTRRLKPLWTFKAVVDALGGPVAVGRLTDQTCAAVCNWRRYHGLFPSKYYFDIKAALADEGYFAPISLFTFHKADENSNDQAA